MKIKTPLTKERLRNHFTYGAWKYILAITLCAVGWNLLYTMTAYRAPEELRVDLYIQTSTADETQVHTYMQKIKENSVPDMETVQTVLLTASSNDYYGDMQLSIYIMAQEGDIYLLRSSDFKKFASQGCFIDLAPYIDAGALDSVEGMDLSAGYVALVDEEGVVASDKILFGIPASSLKGLENALKIDCRDLVIGVTAFSGNEENVITFLNELLSRALADDIRLDTAQ